MTWLVGFVAARKIDPSEGPARQSYGPISGGFIQLYEGTLDPTARLVVGEGIENSLSAAQIAGGLHAISGISAKNLAKINPPLAAEYLIAADNDPPGLRALALSPCVSFAPATAHGSLCRRVLAPIGTMFYSKRLQNE